MKQEDRNQMQPDPTPSRKTLKKMWLRGGAVLLLCVMLALTTYARRIASVSVEDNLFQMGVVDIGLDEDGAIFNQENGSIEPGKTLVGNLTVKNSSDVDVYYRLYLEKVKGGLEDSLIFRIYHEEQLLFQGTADQLTLNNPCKDVTALTPGESRILTIQVYLPDVAGNDYQGQGLEFDIKVDGVQAKNNPQQQFE